MIRPILATEYENVEFGRGGWVHYFGKSATYVHTFLLHEEQVKVRVCTLPFFLQEVL